MDLGAIPSEYSQAQRQRPASNLEAPSLKKKPTERQREKRNEKKIKLLAERIRGLSSGPSGLATARQAHHEPEEDLQKSTSDHATHSDHRMQAASNRLFANELSIGSETDESAGNYDRRKKEEQEF